VGWAVSFECKLFLLTFQSWRFFAVNAVIAAVLTVATVVLAVASRLHFGQGLLTFLEAYRGQGQDPDGDFTIVPDEKRDLERERFPTLGTAVLPTFSSAFPAGNATPPVSAVANEGFALIKQSMMFPPALLAARSNRNAQPSRYSESSWAAGDDVGNNALMGTHPVPALHKHSPGSSRTSTIMLPRT
jgi:hypothetical protein